MINSKSDYIAYLEADKKAMGISKNPKFNLFSEIWQFVRLLRKTEYLNNCKRGSVIGKIQYRITSIKLHKLSMKLGFEIPLNTVGKGLSISHKGTIVIHPDARIGENCRLHVCVNIGTSMGTQNDVPKIGDNVYIGPGAKIFGPIEIGNNTVIGANAVVNKSFSEGNVTIGGVPAKIISDKGRV